EGVDCRPEVSGTLAFGGDGFRAGGSGFDGRLFAGGPPAVAAAPVEGHAPGRADQPGSEPLAIAQLPEAAVGPRQGFLRNVVRVLPVPEHAVGDAERKRPRVAQPGLELLLE